MITTFCPSLDQVRMGWETEKTINNHMKENMIKQAKMWRMERWVETGKRETESWERRRWPRRDRARMSEKGEKGGSQRWKKGKRKVRRDKSKEREKRKVERREREGARRGRREGGSPNSCCSFSSCFSARDKAFPAFLYYGLGTQPVLSFLFFLSVPHTEQLSLLASASISSRVKRDGERWREEKNKELRFDADSGSALDDHDDSQGCLSF